MRRPRSPGSVARGAVATCWLAAIVAAGVPSHAQENLSFELVEPTGAEPVGWTLPRGADGRGYAVGVDAAIARDGARSLRIAHLDGGGIARVTQGVPAAGITQHGLPANRVRLSGYLRTENVAAGDAALWLRVDGPGGFLVVDSRGAAATESDSDPGAQWTRYEIQAPIPDDTREIAFGALLRGGGTAWFDALEIDALDARTLPPPSAVARRYVDAALDIMQEQSINRRSIDWPAFRVAALDQARGATAVSDAHLAVRYALRNLGDHHSYLMTPQAAASLSVTPVSNARTGRKPVAPSGALLDQAVGYVRVPGFAGGSPMSQVQFADRLQGLLEYLGASATCGWILDLRENTGGNLWPMLAGIGPLLGDGDAGASVYPDGRNVPFWYRDGKAGFGDYVQLRVSRAPYRSSMPSAPLALLIGRSTASSGEVLVAALSRREHVRSFGVPTRGLSAGNRTFELSDGAALVMTVAATVDRAGRIYAGPIEPDERVTGDEPVLTAALAWLKGRDGCN
jgi:hypothetical protein